MCTRARIRGSRSTALRTVAVAALLGVALLAGCGDDESAQDRYCEAGAALESSVAALFEVDVIAEGTDGVRAAVDAVQDDVEELAESARDATADDVDALDSAVGDLNDAIAAAGEQLTEENATAVVDAIGAVQQAWNRVSDTLSDC